MPRGLLTIIKVLPKIYPVKIEDIRERFFSDFNSIMSNLKGHAIKLVMVMGIKNGYWHNGCNCMVLEEGIKINCKLKLFSALIKKNPPNKFYYYLGLMCVFTNAHSLAKPLAFFFRIYVEELGKI